MIQHSLLPQCLFDSHALFVLASLWGFLWSSTHRLTASFKNTAVHQEPHILDHNHQFICSTAAFQLRSQFSVVRLMAGIINPWTELLYVTYYPISHTDLLVTADLEGLLMKDFLFDPCQAFCYAISPIPLELFPSNFSQKGSKNVKNVFKWLGPDSRKR